MQFMWGSKRWLAYGYHYFIGDVQKAEGAYKACIEYDPARIDCVIFLSRLYLTGEWDDHAEWLFCCGFTRRYPKIAVPLG